MASVVTKEAVFAACRQLQAEQGQVRQADVQAITGGSFSKIGPWIQEWRVLDGRLSGLEHLDHELLAGLNNWCQQLKHKYQQAAEKKADGYQDEIESLKNQLQTIAEEKNTLLKQVEQLTGQLSDLRETVAERERHIDNKRTELSQLRTERLELKQQLEQEQGKRNELREEMAQLTVKHDADLKAQEARLKGEVDRISQIYEGNENKLYQQLDDQRTAYKQLEKKSGEEQAKLRNEVGELAKQLQEMGNQLVRAQAEMVVAKETLENSQHREDHLFNQQEKLSQQVANERAKAQQAEIAYAQVKGQLHFLEERCEHLEQRLEENMLKQLAKGHAD
ncbi:DNA-binding protein [Endozoicomonas sp. SM1973]|uniref:DNA-binding protein n=1 Tax=Spartinivicinus marinus TaxID=2994442 RepID=A0A853IFR4_9GAMM|nr:DNA-binding protein [Spartinivicinus marinus]NYZ68821.1 DNA-binding protein [Spartinivicinus marinus]